MCCLPIVGKKHNKRHNLKDVLVIIKKKCLKILLIKKNVLKYGAMAKIGCTRKPDGQNRVPRSTLVPGRHFIGQRPPRPDSGRISNGSTRFWLLNPPSATRFQSHLPVYGWAIRPADASSRDAAGNFCGRRGRACGRTLTFVVQSVCDVRM